jgi:hypothetical protein
MWVLLVCSCTGPAPADKDSGGAPDTAPQDTPQVEAVWAEAGEPLEVPVGTPVRFVGTGSAGEGLWDFGDGTTAEGYDVSHVFEAPGNLVAVFQVTEAGGRRALDTVRVTAHLPEASVRPVAASSLDVHDGTLWVAVPEAGHVAGIDLTTQEVRYEPACAGPRTVSAGEVIAVACEEDDAVAWVRPGQAVAHTPLGRGSRPYGVVAVEDGWWVSLQGAGALLHLDEEGVLGASRSAPDARALAVGPGGPWATRLRAQGARAEVHGPDVHVVLEKDPGPDSDASNRGVPTNLHAAVMSPDGGTLYVGATLANTERGLWVESEGAPSRLTFDKTLRATLRVVDADAGVEAFERRRQYDNQGQITAMALSPRGNWLWLAHQGTQTLARIDAYTLTASGVILDAGQGINGLAMSDDGGTLYVHAWLDRTVRAYDVSDPSVPSPPLLWEAPTVASEPLAPEVFRGKQIFHDSADNRLAMDGYLTCHACHPDGRDDGVIWDFTQRGEGLRNTISLVGHGGTAMGPVHWTGNFDEIQDFENDIRHEQGGSGLLSEADWGVSEAPLGTSKAGRSAELDALAAYVSSLRITAPSPHPMPDGGHALFVATGCADCHDPASNYTDSDLGDIDAGRHDVGTLSEASGQRLGTFLDGIDTPTLLGVWATAPYLHDGSAGTLADAILAHAGAEADFSGLPPATVEQLVAYVQALPQDAHAVGE